MNENINSFTVRDISPLRFPGSKKKLVKYLYLLIQKNKITPKIFVEPFVGGGNVFLNFLANEIVHKAIIADKDKLIYSFWKTLFSEPNYLIQFVKTVNVSLRTFYEMKKIANSPTRHGQRILACACIFLNRTSFSGILTKSAGPIGGKEQQSDYKIDCRFNKESIISKLRYIASFKDKVTVFPFDWQDTLNYVEKTLGSANLKKNTLYYLDPPFYYKAEQLYATYFTEDQHDDLYRRLMSFKNNNWILSYDNAYMIHKLYSNCSRMHFAMPYSINSKSTRVEKELIITPLELPKISSQNDSG
jgi:DNA adenine methylase